MTGVSRRHKGSNLHWAYLTKIILTRHYPRSRQQRKNHLAKPTVSSSLMLPHGTVPGPGPGTAW